MDAINLILFAVLFVLQVAIIILLLRRRSGDAGHQTELLARQLQAQDNERRAQIERLEAAVQTLREDNYRQQVKLLELVQNQSDSQTRRLGAFMAEMQKSNEQKLDQMRQTVDEKLTGTLNTRLNASFQTVSQQLESVYKSLGEMQKLSSGVTESVNGLNRVLTNVKSRGTWAEVQLGNILDQTVPGMYDTNVATNPKYNGRVEFAVRIPAADGSGHAWLPIDSKFPMEDYARLTAAAQAGDRQGMESAQKALEQRVRDEAKLVRQYISAPETTPFAVLYLATEGLYAQILGSRSGLAEKLQQQGILLAGPTTVTALLNALAMGFRTLAINRKATEVWQVLGAAKMQYEKFGDLLQKARKKVDEAGKVLDEADHRNHIIQKHLRRVETLDDPTAAEAVPELFD
jgi:DNA recombination protein RmuC